MIGEVLAAVLTTIVPVFTLIGLGVVLARRGLLDAAGLRGLTLYAFSIAAPALLFSAGINARGGGGAPAVAFFAGCLACWGIVFLLARARIGLAAGPASLVSLNASFGNVVAMGIPLILAAYGDEGIETLLGIIGLHSLTLLGLTTVVLELAAHGAGGARAMGRVAWAVVTNPIVAALLAALAWRSLGLPPPPGPVRATLQVLGASAPPVALVSLGAGLAGFSLGNAWREVALAATVKLLLLPTLAWAASLAIGLSRTETAVVVTAAALPTGSNPVLLALRYGIGVDRAGATVVASTLVSVTTLSVLVGLFR